VSGQFWTCSVMGWEPAGPSIAGGIAAIGIRAIAALSTGRRSPKSAFQQRRSRATYRTLNLNSYSERKQ
jgi:hypothetical protein